jgi:uncharacterized phage protein gp47/JayE
MPFARPTLAQLVERNEAELAGRLGLGALLPRSFLAAFARLMAGGSFLLLSYAEWRARQMLPATQEEEFLDASGDLWKLPRKVATEARGPVTFTGNDGASVPIGAELARVDGARFATTETGIVAAGEITLEVEAVAAGFAGNAAPATPLSLTSPISGIDTEAVVATPGLAGGADAETDEQYRARLLERYAKPPAGGSQADYIAWTLEVPGISRAYVLTNLDDLGKVFVTFAVDDDPAGPIPSPGLVDQVQAYLDERRPLGARAVVFAPTAQALDPDIRVKPDNAAVRTAVEAQLADLVRQRGGPGVVLTIGEIREAISTAPGESTHELVGPTADVEVADGALLVLGTITWE